MQKYACLQAYKCMCIYINGETCVCMCKIIIKPHHTLIQFFLKGKIYKYFDKWKRHQQNSTIT